MDTESNGSNDNESRLSTPVRTFKQWYELPTVDLTDFDPWYTELVIKEKRLQNTVVANDQQRAQVLPAVQRILAMLRASDFDTFIEALKSDSECSVTLGPSGYRKMRNSLAKNRVVKDIDSLVADDVLEAYWTYTSNMGFGSRYFIGISVQESYFSFHRLRTIPAEYPNPFPDDGRLVGSVTQPTSFIFDGADPAEEIKLHGSIVVVDVRIMLRTNEQGLAYPICVRLWWSRKRSAWTPWFAIEHNVNRRRNPIVF